jgi:SRSO17 transposase
MARAYCSKPALAAALVEHLLSQHPMRTGWVRGDAAYGNSSALRKAMQQRGLE